MTYYDRHGTEIRAGDRIQTSSGGEFVWSGDPSPSPIVLEHLVCGVVLSRADGTPVYRYETKQCVTCPRSSVFINAQGHSPDCEKLFDHPILGHDRNGREVRRGDRVRSVGCDGPIKQNFTVERWTGNQFASADGCDFLAPRFAELVTDEGRK